MLKLITLTNTPKVQLQLSKIAVNYNFTDTNENDGDDDDDDDDNKILLTHTSPVYHKYFHREFPVLNNYDIRCVGSHMQKPSSILCGYSGDNNGDDGVDVVAVNVILNLYF
uniref:Uncharacterized protein n=1 Tax=Glossina austeni TaxID=7395 RepID=A0A1A9UH26_GLOAU